MMLLRAGRMRLAAAAGGDRARSACQHDVRRGFAHRAGDHADHAGGVRAAASEMAHQPHDFCRGGGASSVLAWAASPQLQWTTTTFPGLPDLQGTESTDLDRGAAGILAEIAAVHRRGAGHRARHRIDARAVRAGRDRSQGAGRRPGRQQSAQSDPARRDPVGRDRRDRALRDLVAASVAVSRRRSGRMDRPDGGGAEYLTSLFNSHLFDFHEGWMYVLGVGVAGGMVLAARRNAETAASHPP